MTRAALVITVVVILLTDLCPNGMTLASNCTLLPGGTVSQSGEGSIAVTYNPTPANSLAINKGEEKEAFGIKIKATGADMNVNRVWVNLTAGTISPRIWLAADKATLLDGSTVLSEIMLSSSTVTEVTAGSEYQLQFNGLNVNVPKDATKVLSVKISRPTLTSNSGTILIAANDVSVRAIDSAGLSEAYTIAATRTLNLANVTGATGTLTATLASSSPDAQSVSGLSTTSGVTTAVKLMDVSLKATDGPINITALSGTITPTGCTSAECLSSVELRDGSAVLDSVAGANTFAFSDLSIDIAEGATKVLSIYGLVNPISATLVAGESVIAAVTAVTATTGTDFTSASITPTVTGNAQYFFQYAPSIAFVSASADNTGVDNKDGTYSLAFSVTAPAGSDIYVDADGATLTAVAKTAAKGGTLASSITSSTTTKGAVATGFHKVVAGSKTTFTVTGYVPAGGTAGFTGMKAVNVTWTATDHATSPTPITQTWGLDDIKTGEVYVKAS